MMRWVTFESIDIDAILRSASYAPTRSSNVRRGKTRNASRFGAAMASAGLDRRLVALRERLIAFGIGSHPALGRRPGERAADLRRRAERQRALRDLGLGRHERACRHHGART